MPHRYMRGHTSATRCLLILSAAHGARATCTPKNTTGCPTVPCGPELHNHTVCYPGACEGLLGKCNLKEHGIQYYCCPTTPRPMYRCVDNQCVQRSGGVEKGLCEQACGPTLRQLETHPTEAELLLDGLAAADDASLPPGPDR